jgi:hypothetical protein
MQMDVLTPAPKRASVLAIAGPKRVMMLKREQWGVPGAVEGLGWAGLD